MDNKEAIAVLKSNYPHGRIMLSEAVDLSIKTLEEAESQTTGLQQLKAEIAAVVNEYQTKGSWKCDSDVTNSFCAKLRQLSAV
jgi:hypothetical protein